MVGNNAIASLEWLYEKAVRENSAAGADTRCAMTPQPAAGAPAESAKRHLVVLTIASYVFRIVALFDFSRDAATAAHMARLVRSKTPEIDGQALDDAFAELVNMICGAVNRRLVDYFPHVGMSTPFVLEGSCSGHLATLDPAHVQSYRVQLDDAVGYGLTLCLCTARDSRFDFQVDRAEHADSASSGELELF